MTDLELYNKAKEAYYNGNPIMTDYEFDELEAKLGLANKSYIGSKKNPSYTIKHPFIMGSLSKVQIKENSEGKIIFSDYIDDISNFIKRNNANDYIVTPKYDGCSFECYVHGVNRFDITISSRGDGEFGKDLKQHLINKIKPNIKEFNKQILGNEYVLRGEVLIDKFIFETKYSEFVNPRSFVSGLLNRDYSTDIQSMIDDLSIVIYDVKFLDDNCHWVDCDWDEYDYPDKPQFYFTINKFDTETLEGLYHRFEKYRNEDCPFALDGIVIKPTVIYRENNLTEHRPKDCVAVKFVPMLQETEIVEIQWQLSNKTFEYTPVIIVKPIIMDGKVITKASAHNYGYVIENKLSIGTKVILSLAGDIIPFIYKITDASNYNINNIGVDLANTFVDGVHLYKKMTAEEICKSKFIASAQTLKIPNIGEATAEKLFDYIKSTTNKLPVNILLIPSYIINVALGGKLGKNANNSFKKYLKNLTVKDIILSCTFNMCGEKVAQQIVNYLNNPNNADWTSLPSIAYNWCFDENSNEMQMVKLIMETTNTKLDSNIVEQSNLEQIPVILTGEPNNYSTKADFLNKNPQYKLTTSWKECKIVFTNDLNSNTSKMKKAKEKNIEIKIY